MSNFVTMINGKRYLTTNKTFVVWAAAGVLGAYIGAKIASK